MKRRENSLHMKCKSSIPKRFAHAAPPFSNDIYVHTDDIGKQSNVQKFHKFRVIIHIPLVRKSVLKFIKTSVIICI